MTNERRQKRNGGRGAGSSVGATAAATTAMKNGKKKSSNNNDKLVVKYLTEMIQNLGINSVNNLMEIPEETWEDMFEHREQVVENIKDVAKDRKQRADQLRIQPHLQKPKKSNNLNKKMPKKGGLTPDALGQTEREEGEEIKPDLPLELLKMPETHNNMSHLKDHPSLLHDNIQYFQNLHSVALRNNPELNDNIHNYLSQMATNFTLFIDDTNTNSTETLKYIQKRRNIPNLPIDEYQDNMHPLHSNMTLFKLVTAKNDNINEDEIPPRIEPQVDQWRYIEKTILTISRRNSILFALDIEGYEANANIITEIGISIYDPRENLLEYGLATPVLHNYHLIVSEYFTLRNKTYLTDARDCFLLGESLILPLDECATFIQSLINYYMFPHSEEDKTWGRCFVGHGIPNDITWLKSINVKFPSVMKDISSRYQPQENDHTTTYIIDTGKFHQILYGDMYGNLGKNLKLYNIPHSFMHNAGNDAYYTLQLILTIGNFKFREINYLDDLRYMFAKINALQETDDISIRKGFEEDDDLMKAPQNKYKYNIPMTEIASVIEFIKMNNEHWSQSSNSQNQYRPAYRGKKKKHNNNNRRESDLRKKRENLLGISQFYGSRWMTSAVNAFCLAENYPIQEQDEEEEELGDGVDYYEEEEKEEDDEDKE